MTSELREVAEEYASR